MRNPYVALLMLIALACTAPIVAQASEADDTIARAKEMLRRTQQALQQAQSDNAELQREKSDADQKLLLQQQAAIHQLASARSGSQALQQALQAQLQAAQGTQADLQRKLNEAAARLVAQSNAQAETARQLAARDAELAQATQALAQSRTSDASCEDKNLKLYGYADEVLQRYQKKGVWAALSQKEPVLGLKEVDVENVVQEYRLKFNSEKVKP